MKSCYVVFGVVLSYLGLVNAYADEQLYGTWRPVTYEIDGKITPLKGLMIITEGYFIGNVTFDKEGDGVLEANANAGPITVGNGTIKIIQWMQLHWRENSPADNFLNEDTTEEIKYTIEDQKLIFHFPTGNRYISERLE